MCEMCGQEFPDGFVNRFFEKIKELIEYQEKAGIIYLNAFPVRLHYVNIYMVQSAVFQTANFIAVRYPQDEKIPDKIMKIKGNWSDFAAEAVIELSIELIKKEPLLNIYLRNPEKYQDFGRYGVYFRILNAVISAFFDFLAGSRVLLFETKMISIKADIEDIIVAQTPIKIQLLTQALSEENMEKAGHAGSSYAPPKSKKKKKKK